jgi:TonB family protein
MLLAVAACAQSPAPNTDSAPVRVTENVHVKKMVDTPYPLRAQQEQIQGRVVLDVTVAADGNVQGTSVISGEEVLASAFEDAVKKWQFEPHMVEGKAVPFVTSVGMNFALHGKVTDKPQSPPSPNSAASTQTASAAAPTTPPTRVRVSSGVASGNLIHKVQPVYPIAAAANHVDGNVILHVVIGKDGIINQLDVVSGPDELIQAAKGAVEQWRYKPYSLNGQPVEVDTKIQINFRFSDSTPPILR